jgi:hypothetical protein
MREPELESRGARDAAAILPFLGIVLLFPPLISIFAAPFRIAGIPLIVVYLFGVWGAVIIAAYLVSRRLKPQSDADGLSADPDAPG